jgi:diguanylate cyclase (GGDEF)-like protein
MNTPLDILVVEDSRVQAGRLKRLLQSGGYRVVVAYNGQEGLEAARESKPHLIVSDIVMPVMDGFHMCRAIRNDDSLQNIPIVMVTSLADPEDILRGLEAGADSYVSKPYEEKVLLTRIRTTLSLPQQGPSRRDEKKLRVVFGGKPYVISAKKQQILRLLLSTYEDAVLQNAKLRDMRAKLVVFNETLEKRVTERTAALQKEVSERKKAQEEREELIAELTKTRDALHFRATHDELTSHWNRAAILRILESELARSARESSSVGIIITDVDHFKKINDQHGHLAGDAVLRAVAQRLIAEVRPYDSVGRYGGEEFLIILPGCNEAMAVRVGERIRSSFNSSPVRTGEGTYHVTLSFGVTTVDSGSQMESQSVVRAADEALYLAKNRGRNRVELRKSRITDDRETCGEEGG